MVVLYDRGGPSYIPIPLESLQVDEFIRDRLIAEGGLVLLQQTAARLRVLGFGDRVLDVGLFEPVERDDDAVDDGEGVVEIALGGVGGELDFLDCESVKG